MLRKKGAETKVAETFYRVVTQAVLLFVSENWVLSSTMERTVEGTHTRFL